MTGDPFDHNGECRHCDEQAMHRADCPWLLALIAERDHLAILLSERQEHREAQADPQGAERQLQVRLLEAEVARLRAQHGEVVVEAAARLAGRQEEIDQLRAQLRRVGSAQLAQGISEDRCRVCHRLIGVGVPFLHLGICEACSGPEAG